DVDQELGLEHLDRHLLPDGEVLGHEHLAHAAGAEVLDHPIPIADDVTRRMRPRRQVAKEGLRQRVDARAGYFGGVAAVRQGAPRRTFYPSPTGGCKASSETSCRSASGRVKKKVVPFLSRLSAHTRPSCASTSAFTIDSPRPTPVCDFLRAC